MSGALVRLKPALRLAAVLVSTYAVFHVALYFWLNCPRVAQERMDRANAAIVAQTAIIYRANGWRGMDPDVETDVADDTMLAVLTPPHDADCFCGDP